MTSDTECSDNDLHIAVRYGDLKEVRKALKCRLSPNKTGLYQWSPLHEAASNGHSDIVQLLLKHGGNPNQTDRLCANTALHYAAVKGHPTCLRLLIEAGGDYTQANRDGETVFDLATRACERIIEKKRVEELMRMPLRDAKRDAENEMHRIESAALANEDAIHPPITPEEIMNVVVDTSVVQRRAKAWSLQKPKHDPACLGILHMSFEYNSKKSYLKIRLWKLTDLLLSETHSSMINTLYIKSTLSPGDRKATKRKSEEIKISTLMSKSGTGRKVAKTYVTTTGEEVQFEPITFKFSKPLVYEPITNEDIKQYLLQLQVSLKQKYTHKTYKVSDLTIPLQVAVTRIVKEEFPLRICTQTQLPETMMVLADTKDHMATASDPNLRRVTGTPLSIHKGDARPASDVNLREILSLSSKSSTASVDMPFDDEAHPNAESLSEVKVESPAADDVTIPLPGVMEAGEEAETREEVEREAPLDSVVVEPNGHDPHSVSHHTVTVISTGSESSSADESLPLKRKFATLFGKQSSNQVVKLESGQSHKSRSGSKLDSCTDINEVESYALVKHKLKPKLPQKVLSFGSTEKYEPKADVVIPVGDLELQDLDEPTKVHTQCKKGTAEQMV